VDRRINPEVLRGRRERAAQQTAAMERDLAGTAGVARKLADLRTRYQIGRLEDDPAFAEASANLESLKGRATGLQRRIQAAHEKTSERRKGIRQAVGEIVKSFGVIGEEVDAPGAAVEDIAGLQAQHTTVTAAIALHKRVVDTLRHSVSRQLATAARPQYAKIITLQCEALRALAAVCAEEREFRDALIDAGAMRTKIIRPIRFKSNCMCLDDPQSGLNRLVNEAGGAYDI